MTLRLSKLHLRAILILVVSKAKGITLVFKNDPLQNVDVSSTFDSVEVIRGYLQQEIEGQLREMFREDLPGIIHRLSQRWFNGGTGGTVETPYRDLREADASSTVVPSTIGYDDELYDPAGDDSFGPLPAPGRMSENSTPRKRVFRRASSQTIKSSVSESPTSYTVFPDIENYDPTYGLRPEGLPTHSGYEAFGRLWEKARKGGGRGLGGLMDSTGPLTDPDSSFEEEDEGDGVSAVSEDLGIDDDERSEATRMQTDAMSQAPSSVEWETFAAVGGGIVTRPRVYHSMSLIRAPSESGFGPAMPSPGGTAGTATGSVTARASSIGGTSTIGSLHGRPQTTGPYAPASPSSLRRATTSSDALFNSRRHSRSESVSAYPPPQRPSSPLRSQSGPGRPRLPHPIPLARTRSNWEHQHRNEHHEIAPSPLRARRMSTLTEPRMPLAPPPSVTNMPRERTTSFGNSRRPGGITLQINNSVSQLATLSLSANTLSPYARAHEHIAVRSFPYLGRNTPTTPGSTTPAPLEGNVKAHRKRIFRLGQSAPASREPSASPEADDRTPSLDWDEETRHASSSSESASRWRLPAKTMSIVSRSSYGFPKIPE